MAYVPGFEWDIFVSYAHVDNEPVFGGDSGWVSEFVAAVEKLLAMEFGRREEFNIWFDRNNLRGHHRIPGISEKVRRSAVMLVILSNGYLRSTFCTDDELNVFLERGSDAADNIYVVRMSPIHESQHEPEELRCMTGCQFWGFEEGKRPVTYGLHGDKDKSYFQKVKSTASDIADLLRELKRREGDAKRQGGAQDPQPRSPGRSLVHLAEVTDDLDVERDQVQRYLEQFGIDVRPTAPYPRPGFTPALDRDLNGCAAFVQLLSRLSGKRLDDEAPRGLPWLQLERAKALDLPIYQWRSPELDLEAADEEQRKLLELATVQATPLAQFQKDILKRIQTPAPAPSNIAPGSVYIDHDPRDEDAARQLQRVLNEDLDVARTPFAGAAASLRTAREKLMLEYESVIFLYGAVKQSWIDRELNAFRALRSQRTQPPRKQIILVTPPKEKPSPSVMLKGSTEVDASMGIDDRVIERLKTQLLA